MLLLALLTFAPATCYSKALLRLPKQVPGAVVIATACPSCAHPLAGILVQGPHCTILNQLLELELMLLLLYFTTALAAIFT